MRKEKTLAGQVSREAGEKDYQSDKTHVRREKRPPVGQVSRESGEKDYQSDKTHVRREKRVIGRTRLT